MNAATIIEGTLKADGTLELDQKPNLAPGRVQVVVWPLAAQLSRKPRGLADTIDEIQQGQRARGYTGRTIEEFEADEADRRIEEEDYDQRMQTLWTQPKLGSPLEKP